MPGRHGSGQSDHGYVLFKLAGGNRANTAQTIRNTPVPAGSGLQVPASSISIGTGPGSLVDIVVYVEGPAGLPMLNTWITAVRNADQTIVSHDVMLCISDM